MLKEKEIKEYKTVKTYRYRKLLPAFLRRRFAGFLLGLQESELISQDLHPFRLAWLAATEQSFQIQAKSLEHFRVNRL